MRKGLGVVIVGHSVAVEKDGHRGIAAIVGDLHLALDALYIRVALLLVTSRACPESNAIKSDALAVAELAPHLLLVVAAVIANAADKSVII